VKQAEKKNNTSTSPFASTFAFPFFVGYWHKDGLDIYRLAGGKIERYASGRLEQLKPVKAWGKKVLIVGRDLLLHSRKKFPPASEADIRKAAQMEIGDLFPLKAPAHFISISERTEAYAAADLWAWDGPAYDALKQLFPFTHVLPEDMAFKSDGPEISVLGGREETRLLAHGLNGFLGVSTFRGDVTATHVMILLKSISRHGGEIKRLNFYGAGDTQGLVGLPFPVVRKEMKPYPVCLEYLKGADLRQFKVQGEHGLAAYTDVFARAVLYILLAYGLSLFISGLNYDAAANEVKTKISALAARMSAIGTGQTNEDYSEAIAELKKKINSSSSPLSVMDMLARSLPEASSVVRMTLSENSLELTLSSKEPLVVIKAVANAEGVRSVKLKGSPQKNAAGIYLFVLSVEL
jgi:hypothetical protein